MIAAKSFFWSIGGTYVSYGIKFILTIWITRLLTPYDYGVVAYASIFITIANNITSAGLPEALIQKKDITQTDYSTAFYFKFILSIFFAILFILISPFVAGFFEEDALVWVLRIVSLNLIINSIATIQHIKLRKDMDFKSISIIETISQFLSGILGVVLAYRGFNFWSIVIMTLFGNILKTAFFYYKTKWNPSFEFSMQSIKDFINFGLNVFLSNLVKLISEQLYTIVIGRHYSTAALGLYSRGRAFFELLIFRSGMAISQVAFPWLAGKNDDKKNALKANEQLYQIVLFFIAPLTIITVLLTKEFVVLFLTETWLPAVPFIKLYLLGGLAYMMAHYNTIIFLSFKEGRAFLGFNVLQKALWIIALIFTVTISIKAVIWGWILANLLFLIIQEIVMYRMNYISKKRYSQVLHVIVAVIPFYFINIFINSYFVHPFVVLLVSGFACGLFYFLYFRLVKPKVYMGILELFINRIPVQYRFILK